MNFYNPHSIHHWFARAVDQQRSNIAIADDTQQLTYWELDAASNRLANALMARHSSDSAPVIVYMERSIAAVVTMLAILKTERPYLPVDYSFSESQLAFIAQDSQAACIVTDQDLTNARLPNYTYADLSSHANEAQPVLDMRRDAPAYIMYTSGSTGRPKGVQIEHSGVLRLVRDSNYISCTTKDVVAHCSSIGFDASTLEIWLPLLNGGQIYVIRKQDVLDFEQFEKQIRAGKVTIMWLTVALFNTIYTRRPETLSSIDTLLIGGDALNIDLVRAFLQSDHCRLKTFLNGYGPTENTTFTTTYNIFNLQDMHTSVPIGQPITGTQVEIIDESGQPVTGQNIGELITSGDGLARGYTCPQETERKFFSYRGQRYYRTGDLVRRLPCGNLEFVSRKDHEVKIRGLRVNLSQVEEAFHQQASVKQCYVRPDKTKLNERLVAYVETTELPLPEQEKILRHSLAAVLPSYMIPERLVLLDSIPLTPNGKVDIEAIEQNVQVGQPPLQVLEYQPGSVLETILSLYDLLLPTNGKTISSEQSFFELGGNSLQIYQLLNLLTSQFNIKLKVKDFLEHQSAKALAALVEQRSTQRPVPSDEPLHTGDLWPISPAQRRLWYVEKLRSSDNLLSFGYTIEGVLDIDLFKDACQKTIAQHDIFNSRFVEHEGDIFLERAKHLLDFAWLRDEVWQTVYEREVSTPFDLHNDSLIRFRLLTLDSNQHLLLLFSNHLVLDGWSVQVLLQTLSDSYECLQKGYPLADREQHDYQRYCLEMATEHRHQTLKEDLAFWCQHLSDCWVQMVIPKTAVPLPESGVSDRLKNQIKVRLDCELSDKLMARAREGNVSLFSILTHQFGQALCQFSGLDEVVLAIPTANREGFANTIGMFVNTIPFRYRHPPGGVTDVHLTLQQCLGHSGAYLDEIQQHLNQQGYTINLDSLQMGIALQNTGHDQGLVLTDCHSTFFPLPTVSARFDLFAHCSLVDQHIEILFEFNERTIYTDYVDSIRNLFTQGLTKVVGLESLDRSINSVNSYRKAPDYIPAPFAATLRSTWSPIQHHVAILAGTQQYTFGQLDADIQLVRRALTDSGVEAGHRIGIRLDPCYEYIVTVFALVLNGCSFVPLDRRYPEERLQFIIDDAALFGSVGLPEPLHDAFVLCKIREQRLHFERYEGQDTATSEDEACLLYTSGSTGTPKGVQICLASILRLTQSPNFLQLAQDTRFMVASSPAFDASLLEIFVPLINGLSCAIVEKETLLDYAQLSRELVSKTINTAWLTVSLFNDIFTTSPQTLRHFTGLLIGGDVLSLSTVREFIASPYCNLKQFVNGYGPTECTTFATWFNILSLSEYHSSVPIGQAINDTQVYILDLERHLCRCGQIGEIAIGAPWLKPNYLNRPALNQEKYIFNPYYDIDRCRYLYLSGDLARYNSDGDIEYIGRRDHMVKIRGHRVELSGINQVLLDHPMVKNAYVGIVEQQANKRIVAYLVPNEEKAHASTLRSELMAYLRTKLEPFQVPSALAIIKQLPLTINGKVDQQKLRLYEFEDSVERIAPRTPLEAQIYACWAELVHNDQFCVTERFFDIGGHSLLVSKVIHCLTALTKKNISFVDFLHHQTVAELATWLSLPTEKSLDQREGLTLIKTSLEHYPVTPGQLNLYFSHEFCSHKALYNIPEARVFSDVFVAERLKKAVNAVMTDVRVLGSTFTFDQQDNLHMTVHDNPGCELSVHQVETLDHAIEKCQELAEVPFDLQQGTLIRFCYLPVADSLQSVIFINIHHIIADEASIQFLFKALLEYYERGTLARSDFDFMDYSYAVTSSTPPLHDDTLHAFWSDQFDGYSGLLKFTPKERSGTPDNLGFRQRFELSNDALTAMTQLARLAQGTLFETALAVYQKAASRVAKRSDIVIGFPYSPRVDIGLIETVGYFVDIIPTRVQVTGELPYVEEIKSLIQTNRSFLIHRPVNQAITYVPNIRRHYNYAPLVQNAFSFHYQATAAETAGDSLDLHNRYCRFDTVFTVIINEGKGSIVVECARDLYPRPMLQSLFDAFVEQLRAYDFTASA